MSNRALDALNGIDETLTINNVRKTMTDMTDMLEVVEKTADEAYENPSFVPTALQVIRHFIVLIQDEHEDMSGVFTRIAYHVNLGLSAPEAVEADEAEADDGI
jgi:hypothetical protein